MTSGANSILLTLKDLPNVHFDIAQPPAGGSLRQPSDPPRSTLNPSRDELDRFDRRIGEWAYVAPYCELVPIHAHITGS
jgi:hypothetical protein